MCMRESGFYVVCGYSYVCARVVVCVRVNGCVGQGANRDGDGGDS